MTMPYSPLPQVVDEVCGLILKAKNHGEKHITYCDRKPNIILLSYILDALGYKNDTMPLWGDLYRITIKWT